MQKITFISLITCLCLIGQSQVFNFNSMNAMRSNDYISSACADSSGNMYACGGFSLINGIRYWGVAKWNGTQWDSLGGGFRVPGQTTGTCPGAITMAFYKNHVYVGGCMNYADGKPIKYVAKWNGTQWDSLPQSQNSCITQMTVINSKLYFIGYSTIIIWDGNTLSPIPLSPLIYDIKTVAEYKGELYVGCTSITTGEGELMKFNGTTWSVVGQGIKGNFTWINALKVFNNELYIGGYFFKGSGNAGSYLMKWDSTNYQEVINGINGQVVDLSEVPDGLIATGCFTNPYKIVLKISNNGGICGYDDLFDNCVRSSVYSNNKLYFYGGFTTVNGDSAMGYINNVNYTTQTDTCMAFVNGIEETNDIKIKIYPNPTTSIINIVDENNLLQNANVQIQNYLGQLVFTSPFTSQINLHYLSAGMYFLTIEDKSIKKTVKIIKE